MDRNWSWKDLPVVGPVIGSSFAFAYVVGYFYAFDIAWFPFFSLPEHFGPSTSGFTNGDWRICRFPNRTFARRKPLEVGSREHALVCYCMDCHSGNVCRACIC